MVHKYAELKKNIYLKTAADTNVHSSVSYVFSDLSMSSCGR